MIQYQSIYMICARPILSIAMMATTMHTPTTGTDANEALSPLAVENVGVFCHTGMVITGSGNFIIKEECGRHRMLFSTRKLDARPGDIVEAVGKLVLHDNGDIHDSVRSIRKLGRVSLPPPETVTLADLARRDFLYRFVTVEGTLVQIRRDEIDASAMQMLVKDGATVLNAAFANVSNMSTAASIPLGARLRLTGVIRGASSGARRNTARYLSIRQREDIEVVRPPPADVFDVPPLDFDSPMTPDEIVRMESRRFDGIVAATWGDDQMMVFGRDFHRIKATLSRPEELPSAGDSVVVAGFPDTDLYGMNLIYARCKPMPKASESIPGFTPTEATLRQLLTDPHGRRRINGYGNGRLLRIKGTVLDVQPSLALFSLNDDGLTIPVDCTSSPDAISRLEQGSVIEAVVLALVETDSWRESIVLPQTRGIKLVLRSADSLKILARPPWWTPTRLTAVVISLLVVIVLIIAANRIVNRLMMRRKVSERTRLAVELHDSLSQTLAGVACQIAAGENAVEDDPKAAKDLLQTAERMLESSRTELKNCLFDLRNDTMDDPDFARAIDRTLMLFRSEADISIRFHATRSQMTDTTAHAVLCIIRELVANAVRHGGATRIRVAGAANGELLRFSVRDNGGGFDPKRHPGPRDGHFGLAGIRERLAGMAGKMSIESIAGQGTKATISLKLRPQKERE